MSDRNVQLHILKGLLSATDYIHKYLDKLEISYFDEDIKPIVKCIKKFHLKYHKAPSISLLIEQGLPKLLNDEEKVEHCSDILQSVSAAGVDIENFYEFLLDETKKFILNQRMIIALQKVVEIMPQGQIDEAVKIVNEAAAINFDTSLGLDYFEDLEDRIERLKIGKQKIDTGIATLNKEINGGWRSKTLIIFGAGTNVGKTLVLEDIALKQVKQGRNCLYITLEIYEDLLANRFDSNLTDIPLSEIESRPEMLMEEILRHKKEAEDAGRPFGRLFIKEYAPQALNSNGILSLVRELQIKQNFKPDSIVVDYIGLVGPNGKTFSDNTYGKLKTVAEELRAVASLLDVPIFSAVQMNREGYSNSNPGLENTADSMGIPQTCDKINCCCFKRF